MTQQEPVGELPLLTTAELPDGTRLPVRALRAPEPERFLPSGSGPAPGPPPAPAVLILPAMGVPARFYRRFARQLHDEGLTVLTVDLRGQGEATPSAAGRGAPGHGYRAIVEDDLPAVVAAIRDELGTEPPLFLLGHSLGGQLGLVYAATARRPAVDGVAVIATGSVWFRAFAPPRGAGLLLLQLLIAGTATVLGRWPGTRLGFGGNQPKGVMRDWARQVRTGRYSAEGSALDYESALATLTLPVLAISVDGDAYAPASSLNHLLSKVPEARVTRRHCTTQEAGAELDHFTWTRAAASLAKWVAAWTTEEHPHPRTLAALRATTGS
ncbi:MULTISPECIES: alpha/beta fold hydrolase [Streptomyces]|nr:MULTISPECIES: alpha/beta fold hydrolase [Streptomyces]MYY84626.1 alpha/beta fold hydrolase [Streptomyces sp. SID335]MYZ16597.1 alpha/beta fold hydrolase [Streptomyces sp. SID337]NEB45547.1 alpha/beta fold hydrolase [Streptomyces sp. SID339]